MDKQITETMIFSFDGGVNEAIATYAGQIIECTCERVGTSHKYAVTKLIVDSVGGYRMLSVSLNAGIKLFQYINSENRNSRMDKIRFQFIVHDERQHVRDYMAYDPEGWIGKALEMESRWPCREVR